MSEKKSELLKRYYEDVILRGSPGLPFEFLKAEDLSALSVSAGFIYFKLGAGSKLESEESFKKLREAGKEIKGASKCL